MVVSLKKVINANSQPQLPLAFGSRAPRFGKKKVDTKDLKRDVGCEFCEPRHHQPTPVSKVYEVNKNVAKRDVWRHKFELEEWSKNLGYRNAAVLEERRFRATCGGPATCDIQEINTDFSRRKNTGFGTALRFKPAKFVTPAPGTYYKPTPFKAPHGPDSSDSKSFYGEPRRFKVVPWSLAPNRYKIIDKESIEMKPKKLVSLRGPYDLFTGPRDDTTIKNHFGTNKRDCCPSWPMALPDFFERLKKSHFGEMNKTGREAHYSGRKPGLADVNLNPLTVFKQNKVPFLSSYNRPRGLKLEGLRYPGVGRYDIQPCLCTDVPGNGHKHVFLSKVPRTSGCNIKPPMNSF